MILGTCKNCGAPTLSYPCRIRRYCSKSCGISARNKTDQNPSYHRDVSGAKNPMYGKPGMIGKANPMYGKRNELAPRWKGGRKVRKDGYVFVVAPDDHPYPAYTKKSGLKYILEHRYVMEQSIGRYLLSDEVVHHIDENPSNNDITNLRLYANIADHIRDAHGADPLFPGMQGRWYGSGWDKQHDLALERDQHQCQDCGASESKNGRALHVHHIRRFILFADHHEANHLDNLITVCAQCHKRREP